MGVSPIGAQVFFSGETSVKPLSSMMSHVALRRRSFFALGHVLLSHVSVSASLRANDRRCGRCELQPIRLINRQTPLGEYRRSN
jgi:hypothetical protein